MIMQIFEVHLRKYQIGKKKALLKDNISVELICGVSGMICWSNTINVINALFLYIGDGKSHYILNRLCMTCSAYVTIPMHEGFSYQQVIERLRSLPLNSGTMAKPAIYGVFFNFTMCYQKVTWVCGIIYGIDNDIVISGFSG